MINVGRDVEVVNGFGCAVQKREAGITACHHRRHIVHTGDGQHDAGERIVFQPDLDVGVGIRPKAFAVEGRGISERLLDAVECARFALPASVIGEVVVRQHAVAAHLCEIDLNFAVTAFGFLDEPADRCLVEHLPDRHRPARLDDLEQCLTPGLDFGFGRADPFYGASLTKSMVIALAPGLSFDRDSVWTNHGWRVVGRAGALRRT
jgi:hypothetical protein